MDSSQQDPDPKSKVLQQEGLNQNSGDEVSTLASADPGGQSDTLAEPTAGTAIAPAGAEADDALLDALAAISVDHAFIDHALDQLTGSVDLFDVPSLHSGVSSDFFGPDNTG
jgi:hypothetical protein